MKISVKTPCRLHLTLIDLNGSLGRIDGGVGIALEKPGVVVEVQNSSELTVDAGERSRELTVLCKNIIKKHKIKNNFNLKVRRQIPHHAGLGSTTQLYLATVKALLELNKIKSSAFDLALLTGRGGTSGIGVGAFEAGGFMVECGHSYGKRGEKKSFLPSSYSKAGPPPIACRLDFPDWNVLLCIPQGRGLHSLDELEYFREHFPVSEREAERISRIVLMKLIPSAIEKNLREFSESVRLINRARSFKFPKETQKIISQVNKLGGKGTSMTSFGPTVFTFTSNPKTKAKIKNYLKERGLTIETRGLNHGATVKKT